MKKIIVLIAIISSSLGFSQVNSPLDSPGDFATDPNTDLASMPNAPTQPTRNAWDVISIYSDAYANVSNVDYYPNWGQGTTFEVNSDLGDPKLHYSNLDYQGISFTEINISSMTKLHLDIWTSNITQFKFYLIGGGENGVTLTPTLSGWNSYDIDLSTFVGVNQNAIFQIKLEKPGFSYHGESNSIYIDNIYFWKPTTSSPPPSLGSFTVPAHVVGDSNFELTAPTSNSLGQFTFSSSNTNVATVSGSIVTVVGAGTSIITAVQAAQGEFSSGTKTASLVVTSPPLPSIPLNPPTTNAPTPPVRNVWDVISVYSDAYATNVTTDYNPGWGQMGSVNTTYKPVESENNYAMAYTNFNYQGTNLTTQNASSMEYLHMDIWTSNATVVKVSPINNGTGAMEFLVNIPLVINGWSSINLPKSAFVGMTWDSVFQMKFDGTAGIQNSTIYLDNIYFWKPTTSSPPPTLGSFTVPAHVVGDSNFELTAPTSNSLGQFTFSSSNTNVATVSGSIVTVVGAGTSIITAVQAAQGAFSSGTKTASLVVTSPPLPSIPLNPPTTNAPTPPVRNVWDVISVYSDAYATNVTTDYNPNWGQMGSVNTTYKPIESENNYAMAYTNFNYQGTNLSTQNASSMEYLHMDIWTSNATVVKVSPINNGTGAMEFLVNIPLVINGWSSINLPKSAFVGMTWDSVFQMKFDGTAGIQNSTIYLDNIYFWKTSSIIQNLCTKTIKPYNVNVGDALHNGSTYAWSISPTAPNAVISGNGSAAVTIDWTDVPDGSYTLQAIETSITRCVSTAVTAVINLYATPVPVAQSQTFCTDATVANLVATGTNLQWYTNPTGGAALDSIAILTTGTYYVSQTLGTCESSRTPVSVIVSPQTTPTFTPIASSCSGETITELPTTSNNGITGTWSPAINNNVTTNYTFTPNEGQCAATTTQTITVTPQVTPTFTTITSTCSGATIDPLPTTSNNGITGTWSPALNNNETTTYTFTPTAGQCANTTTQTITITAPKVTSPISFVAATLGALNCGSTSVAGTLTSGIAARGVSSSVPYNGGNGGSYQAQTIASTGVTGLTATLAAGTFATGAGNLTYTITGTPASSGTASFALNIGGLTCTLTLTVNATVGTITDLNCASAINSGTLMRGTAASGVSSVLSYTGGTGGAYSGQIVSSTGVTGLTATLNSGTFANGAGSLTYTITGTPASIEIASFPLNIGGQTCTLELTVQSSAIVFNPNLTYGNITDIDGNNYKTIQIGDKRWMAENLKVTKYSNGDIIPNITDGSTWYNSSSGAWAYYNNNSAYNTVYGKIYNGYAASDTRNVCPSNWRVPNEQDWSSLEEFIGIPLNEISNTGYRGTDQAKKVKETGNRHWADLQGMFGDTIQNNATNEVGLTLIPTGYRGTPFGQFESINYSGYYWGNPWQSARFFLSYGNQIIKNVNDTEPFGMAIRCVKDETPPQGSIGTLDCLGATNYGTLTSGTSASGVSSLVHYTGGNGGTHSLQTVTSTGVTGLTATLAAGTFATGAGNLTYTITGTPASSGTASFALNIGGQTCALTLTVAALPSVTIGTQIWTSKNLDVATYRDGTPIPQVTDPTQWANLTTGAWCYYNNDPANGEVYGKLYNWYAVAGIYDAASLNDPTLRKQLAPIGWHVPSDAEWTVVTDFLGGESIAGEKMKETGTNHWTSPNTGTTNTSGFTGLPGGYYFNYSSQFSNILDFGYWWSSSELGTNFAWYRNLYYNFGNAYRSNGNKTFGLSVRLLKD